ncbi:MAG: hypothetical protein IPP91_02870 [Betaproteobacteria bacterium]|nr:hypothetical protein [Betaproteobacteria bacterium]
MDLRDQIIKEALDKTVGPYQPEKKLRPRLARVATIAVLAVAAALGVVIILNRPASKLHPSGNDRNPVTVNLLPAPEKR